VEKKAAEKKKSVPKAIARMAHEYIFLLMVCPTAAPGKMVFLKVQAP
jgi:hypothetical protein